MLIVFSHQPVRDHQVVDIVEDEGTVGAVELFLLKEVDGVVAPVAAGVEVVGSMVAVVEAVTVALVWVLDVWHVWRRRQGVTYGDINKGDAGAEVRGWFDIVDKGVLAPVTYHHCYAHLQEGEHENEERGAEVVRSGDVDEGVG